jgi:transcriptional antiterminator RfaH
LERSGDDALRRSQVDKVRGVNPQLREAIFREERLSFESPYRESAYKPQWYVAKTKPHIERQAARVLESRQISVYLPLLRSRNRVEPLFPGYLFLRIDLHTDDYLRSQSAPGITYILGSEPIAVPEELIQAIRERVDRENVQSPVQRFKQGDQVIIASGPFDDIQAIFDRALSPRGRCFVLLEVLGRITRVQLDADALSCRTSLASLR